MKFQATVAALLITLPLAAFSANLGTNSGGGGDPKDLKTFKVSAVIEKQMASIDGAEVQVKVNDFDMPESLTASQKERHEQLQNVAGWFRYAAKTFRVLKSVGYPFNHPSLKSLRADRVDGVLEEITIVHGKNLRIGFRPVTFISHPDTRVVEVDYEKFFDFVNREGHAVREKEYKEIAVKMLTIAIHEILVLEQLEASKTYDASSEFGDAFVLMLKGDLFWRWAMTKLPFFQSCPYEDETEYRQEVYEDLKSYFDSEIRATKHQDHNFALLHMDLEERKEDFLPPISTYELLSGYLFTGVKQETKAAVTEYVARTCGIR